MALSANLNIFVRKSSLVMFILTGDYLGVPVAQWVKRWPTDLADRVRSSLEVKSSQP